MSPNHKRIAAHVVNPITLTQLVLGTVHVKPLDVDHPDEPFELDFVPVANAYVLVREHGAPSGTPRIGRTNEEGRVLERDASDVHGPLDRVVESPPQYMFLWEVDPYAVPARDQMLLDTSVRYELFWCYEAEHFERAFTALRDGRGAVAAML
ncbi:MAG TPA: hypothetical protein VFX59_07080, partial [Polyangiales bacterium]|nr:hypothetical protein [Polyangiales bacterium]